MGEEMDREVYKKAIAEAWEAVEKALAPRREFYQKALAPVRAAFREGFIAALERYGCGLLTLEQAVAELDRAMKGSG